MLKRLTLLSLVLVLFSACEDDPIDLCASLECGINGTCVSGYCDCEDGYSGVNCEIFDPCYSTLCGNNGTCVGGICDCENGYYGEFCELLIHDRFVGTWSGIGCNGEVFNLIILPGDSEETLIIKEPIFDINANIVDENNFDVPEQEFIITTDLKITVVGTGKILENGFLEFDASVAVDDDEPETCLVALEKQ